MSCAGRDHTVVLRSDGNAVACGNNSRGQCDIPQLPQGVTYSQVSLGHFHTVLLRNDGHVVACGFNGQDRCSVPDLPNGVKYSQVSAGSLHTVLLRTDGTAVAFGWNETGECDIPDLPEGVKYWQVSAGALHTLLLRSDGQAVACGKATLCNIPELPDGIKYVQVVAGAFCSILLRSDGGVSLVGCADYHYNSHDSYEALPVANTITCSQRPGDIRHNEVNMGFGGNNAGQISFPHLPNAVTYSDASAGRLHIVLLQNDGVAVACGSNEHGQCNIPPLEDGTKYVQVSAGADYTVLLRSDNRIMACGRNDMGQCDVPEVRDGFTYLGHTIMSTVLQLFCANASDGQLCLTFRRMSGEIACTLMLPGDDFVMSVPCQFAKKTGIVQASLRLVLPSAIMLHALSPSTQLKDLLNM